MSKRAGTLVTLADLLDDIGVDAARFFLVQRSHETPLDLDLDVAREQSQENPVYYVQYAHARVCSILAQAGERAAPADAAPRPHRSRPRRARAGPAPRRLADGGGRGRAAPRAPTAWPPTWSSWRGTSTPSTTAAGWWGRRPEVEGFRLDVCRATGATVRLGLDLLGVEAPERM